MHTMCWQLISHTILHTSYVRFTYTRGNVKYYYLSYDVTDERYRQD